MDDTRLQIRQFLTRLFRHDSFSDDDHIFRLGFVNSLFAIQLIQFVESELSVQVGEEDLNIANFQSVSSIADFVNRKRTATATATGA